MTEHRAITQAKDPPRDMEEKYVMSAFMSCPACPSIVVMLS